MRGTPSDTCMSSDVRKKITCTCALGAFFPFVLLEPVRITRTCSDTCILCSQDVLVFHITSVTNNISRTKGVGKWCFFQDRCPLFACIQSDHAQSRLPGTYIQASATGSVRRSFAANRELHSKVLSQNDKDMEAQRSEQAPLEQHSRHVD